MPGGNLTVLGDAAGDLQVGSDRGIAFLNQTGGSLSKVVGQFSIGGDFGTYDLSGGVANLNNITVGIGHGGVTGNLEQTGGTLNATGQLQIGVWDGLPVTPNLGYSTAGGFYSLRNDSVLNSTGPVRIGVGSSVSGALLVGEYHHVEAPVGNFHDQTIILGESGGSGALVVSSGTVSAGTVYVGGTGSGSNGTLTVRGGAVMLSGAEGVSVGRADSSVGFVNLEGGRLTTSRIGLDHGTGTLNFSGGRLIASQDNAAFISGFSKVSILDRSEFGGTDDPFSGDRANDSSAVIDSNGHQITIVPALTGPGILDKKGAGTLTLAGANTYSGGTYVEEGMVIASSMGLGFVTISDGATLTLTSNDSIGDSAKLTLEGDGSKLVMNFSGVESVSFLLVDGINVAEGDYSLADLNARFGIQFDGNDDAVLRVNFVPVPEVSTLGLFGFGLMTLVLLRGDRKKQAKIES